VSDWALEVFLALLVFFAVLLANREVGPLAQILAIVSLFAILVTLARHI